MHGAECGNGGGTAGGVEGGWSLCAAGCEISGTAAAVHGGGQRSGAAVDGEEEPEAGGGMGSANDGDGGMVEGERRRAVEEGEPRSTQRWGEPGLCDLYVGFDGEAQGSDGGAAGVGEPGEVAPGGVWGGRGKPGQPGGIAVV